MPNPERPLQPVSLTLTQALQKAIAHHQSGQLQEAERLYRTILQNQPNHPEANHNLGILTRQLGEHAAALPYLKTALAINPAHGQYALSYASTLLETGQATDALNVIQNAIERGLNTPAAQSLRQKVESALLGARVTVQEYLGRIDQANQPQTKPSNVSLSYVPKTDIRVAKKGKSVKERSPTPRVSQSKKGSLSEAERNALVVLFNAGRHVELESRTHSLLDQHPDTGFIWKILGASFQVQGKDALPALQKAAGLLPKDADVHSNLGNALQAVGQLHAAVASYRLALRIRPRDANTLSNLGTVLQTLGRLDDAVVSYRQALDIKPHLADAHYNLGNAFLDLRQTDDAVASYCRAIKNSPDFDRAHYNLGKALQALGRLDGAVTSYCRALEIRPDYVEAHYNLGNTLQLVGRPGNAAATFRRALGIQPYFAEAHNNLGATLKELGQLDAAVASYRRAVAIKPDYPEVHYNLGVALKLLGGPDDEVASYRRALEIKPDYAEAHYNLGVARQAIGWHQGAVSSYRHALEINPHWAEADSNLGGSLQTLGLIDAAVASYRRALQIQPDFVDAHSNLIFTLDLAPGVDLATLRQERNRWEAIHAAPLAILQRPHANRPDPHRRLRIGYVSADFREHSATVAFGAMLVKFDPAGFEVFAYSNSPKQDAVTRLFQHHVPGWRDIVGLADEAVANLIRQDEIDILVDLSGHSAGNRLLVFARKPAPLQVTAWGYNTGTGLRTIDVLFADPIRVPPEEKHFYTEEVRYLPSAIGYYALREFPQINPLPALSNHTITFGSLNRLAKVSEAAYQAWAQILLSVPDSRMVLKTAELDDAGVSMRILQHFTEAGIDPARMTLLGKTSWVEHVAAFGQVDIALDPFPQGGGVTTLEGLMMGVPVVTLRWPTFTGRASASSLTTLGLTDWIAESPEQYVELALRKARDVPALAALRTRLREIFTSSIIGDSQAYVKAVEQEYRQLWREWGARRCIPIEP